mmetsp:Transcript_45357/g.147472  ORF Transcript_45357/g.147472 Transcript_45357/m.147472 type:complete len:344 (-) Transcript_45357:74-1105(-)
MAAPSSRRFRLRDSSRSRRRLRCHWPRWTLVALATWIAVDQTRRHLIGPVDRPQPAVPFVLHFESSTGSSWLMELLGARPDACVVGFEPIDNITMSSPADHAARIRWLRTLWSPSATSVEAWESWQQQLLRASVFGQRHVIRTSLHRCSRQRARAFGLKARLSRLLSHPTSVPALAALMRGSGARMLRLSRRNRIKQAMAEYNRLHAGRGQFVAAATYTSNASRPRPASVHVHLDRFRQALRAVERSHRLSTRLLEALEGVAVLHIDYEDLLGDTERTMTAVANFLELQTAGLAPPATRLLKATPDHLCSAVKNYRQVCSAYLNTEYERFFDAPTGQCACGRS